MNKHIIEQAKKIIFANEDLKKSLEYMFEEKNKKLPEGWGSDFDNWLDFMVRDVAENIPEPVTPERIFTAMQIQAIGEHFAIVAADTLIEKPNIHRVEINCYVADGVVNSSVRIEGESHEDVLNCSEWVKELFHKNGYDAELFEDEEEQNEITVNARIDFDIYVNMEVK